MAGTEVNKSLRVGVLMGGLSVERPVSLKTGEAVLEALISRGWDAVAIDVDRDVATQLVAKGVQVAWIALHGPYGEDGCIQGLLEILGIPYTGSDVRSSAVCMDKISTKRMLQNEPIRVAQDAIWKRGQGTRHLPPLPVAVKDPVGGSSLGLAKASTDAELRAALDGVSGPELLVEEWVEGEEITVAVLDGNALPVVRILPHDGFFDYAAKYTKGMTTYEVPAQIPDATRDVAMAAAERAYRVLGCRGLARVDFLVSADGEPVFLEVNTLPGMTATSLSPMAAGELGIDFPALVERILLSATCRAAVSI